MPGVPLNAHSPFVWGFLAGLGALLAWWLGGLVLSISSVLVLVVVSLFLAVGPQPARRVADLAGDSSARGRCWW